MIMKRVWTFLLALTLLVSMTGCRKEPAPVVVIPESTAPATTEPTITEPATTAPTEPAPTEPEPTEPETTEPAPTEPAPTEPEPTEPETTEPAPTEEEHSELYLYYIPVEDVITWFNEVCLDVEFSHGGDPSLVQKWENPIYYSVEGDATAEDLAVLESFVASLNYVEGFPGMYPAEPGQFVNLRIHFTGEQELLDIMGQDYVGSDGAVTFWYDGDNRIYEEVICIRNDLDQYLRNSVILEEIYNGLGPVQDTMLRPDSIIYQEYAEPQDLTLVDWLILRLLYHPDIKCGMNAEECEAVIRSLYY